MLKIKLKSRRIFYISILISVLLFAGSFSGVTYYGNELITKQQIKSQTELAKLDKTIADIKSKKIAEKAAADKKAADDAAARKAAETKATAETALKTQHDQAATPNCAISGAHGNPDQIDVLINKKHCFSPIDFAPSDIVYYQGYPVSNKIYSHLVSMLDAAASSGEVIGLTSAYRSYSNQLITYNKWVAVNGSTAAADTVSARPGYSEHQSGFAVDLDADNTCNLECFAKSSQYVWMKAHAADYGFVQRYQSGYESFTGYNAEAWHWRYVGSTVATDMKAKGIHTLEQYWGISGGGY
ncbi:MAG: M15 family metallopeptidase [Candidatus Nomurabacteria bacterium]|nr:MAG: M15 family metallopeptidase [Candidatus Nomurabacteria bacterium]